MIKIEHVEGFGPDHNFEYQSNVLYTDGMNCRFFDEKGQGYILPLNLFIAIEELVRQNAMFRTQLEENHSHDHGCSGDENPMGYVALSPDEIIQLFEHFSVEEIIKLKEAGVY